MRYSDLANDLKKIKEKEYPHTNHAIERILDIDEELNGDCEYVWGNNEIIQDDVGNWEFITLFNKRYPMDHYMIDFMCDVLLEEINRKNLKENGL